MTANLPTVMAASVWVSAPLTQDINHRASLRWLAGWLYGRHRPHAPVLVVSELAGAVARRTLNANRGHRAAARLRRVPRICFVPIDTVRADDAADLGLRGADAVYLAVARRRGFPLITWDQEVSSRSAPVIRIRTL